MKSSKKNKYYLVVAKNNGYTHGAFPFTPEGLEDAKKYIKKSLDRTKEVLIIEEKG